MLDLKTVEPFGVSGYVLGTFFGKHEVISGMGPASRRFIVALSEAFKSVLPDGGEHKEARFFIDLLHLLHQALVHHGSHAVEHVEAQIAFGIAHGFHAFQRAAAGKYGKPAKESLFSAIEEAVTPVHGVAKRLLPSWQIAGAAGQQVQAAFEACQHGGRRKQLDARRGKFDGQREAVKARADGRHRGCVFLRQCELVLHSLRTFHKERDRWKTGKHFQRRHGLGVGQRERGHGKFMFAVDMKRRLARDHHPEFGAGSKHFRHDRRGGDEVLEVVEQEEHRLAQAAHVLYQAFLQRRISGFAHAHCLRDRGSDQASFANR